MKHTIIFSSLFLPVTTIDKIEVVAETYHDIFSAIYNLVPALRVEDSVALLDNDRIITLKDVNRHPKRDTIIYVPTFTGGSVSDVFGNLEMFYGNSTAFSSNEVYLSGITRRILDSSLSGKAKTAYDIAQRTLNRNSGKTDGNQDPSTGFGSLNHTSLVGQAIPLIYGRVRTSGAIINQFSRNIQNDYTDTIYDINTLLSEQ